MRISSATWLPSQDAHGRWRSDRWFWFLGCDCSFYVVRDPNPKMKETTFLRLARHRAHNRARSNLVRSVRGLAAKVADDASSPGFPSLRSDALPPLGSSAVPTMRAPRHRLTLQSPAGAPTSPHSAAANVDPIDVSLTVPAPPRSLIPRRTRPAGRLSKDGFLSQPRGGIE